MKKAVICLLILIFVPREIFSQAKTPFSGDPLKFRTELTTFMGPNLNDLQKANLNTFLTKWDSAAFNDANKYRIMDVTSQFYSRAMRPVPHLNNLITALNQFATGKTDDELLSVWLTGLSETVFNPRLNNDNIDRYVKNTSLMIRDNILAETASLKWKVKNCELEFIHDTTFLVEIKNATLTCYSMKDSTEIYNVTGTYNPELMIFRGRSGRVTWEKAGYAADEVFAEMDDYVINTTKNNFTIDSARLTYKSFFKTPVKGVLIDQCISFRNKERANFPRFDTYAKEFKLENIYQGMNYEGGLTIEGASVKGTGSEEVAAKVTLSRNDTLYLKLYSSEYLFTKTGLASAETAMTLYLDKDSIYHSNLGFSYIADKKLVNLYRANNPVSGSPYFDSFHQLDMYFELLSWDMNESKIVMTRPRGAAQGMVEFESGSFFNAAYFAKLAGIDQYHPLAMLRKFADWYYSDTFPVQDFATWLGKSVESTTALCSDMANMGFVFYDRKLNKVTLKKKVNDFLTANVKKKDYDVIYFTSETKAPLDNAILDLKNYRIKVNGVSSIFLSDSQRVAIYPYNQQVEIGRNRNLSFDGVVEAGLFTIFGRKFTFDYDTFKIRLQSIDSIKIAVETENRDAFGNPLIKDIDNLIQLGTAELYIDDPNNKSGLRSLKQYPVINAVTYSYIFYDDIPGLEGIYPQQDFYFRIDPFTYENIDHYKNADMNLAGEFHAGKILKPMKQFLTIQENNSLGFNMNIPAEGIDVYESKGKLFDNINMSNKGLIGSGTLKHLTSTTTSEEFRFFPDSMLTTAQTFKIAEDGSGTYPLLNAENVRIEWQTDKDEWMAYNAEGKNFNMYDNGTMLAGSLKLKPGSLNGSGVVGTTDSRITSDLFRFTSNSIKADTSTYNLNSTTTTGYAFIAENARTDINFDTRLTTFRLNTDTSVVKFPEMQYICTMTDFTYNMDTKVLDMEQKGRSDTPLLPPEKLKALDFGKLDKPTFFATNVIGDTVSFSSWKGRYYMKDEHIEAENINYIHIADALIQPDKGKITIQRRAKITQLQNAIVAVNNRHLIHDAKIDIESTKKYSGNGIYDYIDENKEIQQIAFTEITVDTMATSARGFIPVSQKFMLNPAFSFSGDVNLFARKDNLSFTGAAGIVHDCSNLKTYSLKFKDFIDPLNVMIPVSDKPRDINDNMVFSGSFINLDSIHIYPAFLSAQKSWTDVGIVKSSGYLYFDKAKSRYLLGSLEKIVDPTLHGSLIAFDKNFCVLSGEGQLDFGTNFDLVGMKGAGKIIHRIDSGDIKINAILAFDFFFSPEAIKMMSDEIRLMPSLKPVNLNSEFYSKGMKDLLGVQAAQQISEEINLFGTSRNLPKDFNYEIVLNDVNLYWNEATSSFRSEGKIGIGFIGSQPLNVYVDGFVELQRRRSGDMFDIYLKADESTFYYFSYIRGNMMAQAGNNAFNSLIATIKLNDRKHPDATVRQPYIYMISVEDRLGKFINRMTNSGMPDDNGVSLDGLVR